MNKEQLGAASGNDAGLSGTPDRCGWLKRLSVQPGFRPAAIAFALTVVLGIGGTAAYALWSSSFPATVTAMAPSLPTLSVPPVCNSRGATTVSWAAPAGMPNDAVFLVEVTKTGDKKGSLAYAFPKTTTEFQPANLSVGKERFHDWMYDAWLSPTSARITVSVAALPPATAVPVRLAVPLDPTLSKSTASQPVNIVHMGTATAWYECR